MNELIDTHAHLDEIENPDEELHVAKEAGLKGVIAMGSNHESNLKVLVLSEKYPVFVFPALGLHPMDIHKFSSDQIAAEMRFIEGNIDRIRAIGEIGLDYNKGVLAQTGKDAQKDVFRRILEIAKKYNKPVSIHSRYAWKDCFDLAKEAGIDKAVFHWFTGFSNVLRNILDSGYYISGNPAAEYHEEHRRAIRETPLLQLLLETDCPVWYGREIKYESRPADIVRSLKAVASVKEMSEEVVAQATTSNCVKLFNILSKIPDE
jgi:TatD DNase family protein